MKLEETVGFEPRMAKAYETLLLTRHSPHYKVETAYTRAVDISVSRVTYLYVVHFIRLTLTSCHPVSGLGMNQLLSFSLHKL